jgi:hypothetical protein
MKVVSCFLLMAMAVFALPWACTKTLNSPVTAVASPTPISTATTVVSAPITISVTSANLYSVNGTAGPAISAPITVVPGQVMVFDISNNPHPLYIDNGSGTCSITNQTSFPFFYTISGAAGTMYTFHCGIHGLCGITTTPSATTCTLPCGNMYGVFHVQ